MGRHIRLLGARRIERDGLITKKPAGRKAWGLLAYLVLADQPPTRQHLAQLLFSRADDPMAALRWNLSQLRGALGDPALATGDPVVLGLDEGDRVDVQEVLQGQRPDEPGLLGDELLEGLSFDAEPAFAAWLDLARHTVRAASETLLADVLADLDRAAEHLSAAALAQRALLLDEFNVEHHAALVRSLVLAGAQEPARRHVDRVARLYEHELDIQLPDEVELALTAPSAPTLAGTP